MKSKSYPIPQIILHWVIAIIIAVAYIAILVKSFQVHFVAGVIILLLGILRLVFLVAFKNRKPDVVPPLPKGQYIIGTLVKIALAIAFIILPATGILFRYFGGRDLVLYGHMILPGATEKSPMLASLFHTIHVEFSWIALGIIVIHFFGAIYNFLVVKNNVLERMMPMLYKCGYSKHKLEDEKK